MFAAIADDPELTVSGFDANLNDVYFVDEFIGYAVSEAGPIVGDPSAFIKTVDGGDSWQFVDQGTTTNINTIAFVNNTKGYTAGAGNVHSVIDKSALYSSLIFYDAIGRVVASQNSRQRILSETKYSYTRYDGLGRPFEAGELEANDAIEDNAIAGVIDDNLLANWMNSGSSGEATIATGIRTEVTKSYYTFGTGGALPAGFTQNNTRNRITAVTIDAIDDNDGEYDHATHYSYDIHGNVTTLVQDNPSMTDRFKEISYKYDLLSGNVNEVNYQKHQPDEFNHQYTYDASNRLTSVFTSRDGTDWEQDAKYFYLQHGPMYRTELAHNKVQGIDYAYNLQGWLKGVNSNTAIAANDQGEDGVINNIHSRIGRDAYGYSLAYFENDYTAIGTSANQFMAITTAAGYLATEAHDLYNGNISHMVTAYKDINSESSLGLPQLTAYRYDQLNRIKQMRAHQQTQVDVAANAWSSAVGNNDFATDYSYDANGNLQTLTRNAFDLEEEIDDSGTGELDNSMDDLAYIYENVDNGYARNTNRLKAVLDRGNNPYDGEDNNTGELNFTDVSNNQPWDEAFPVYDESGQLWDASYPAVAGDYNYDYDAQGNLISDVAEEIETITWTTTGKVKSIERTSDSERDELEFIYDAMGNRIAKIAKPFTSIADPLTWTTTHYVRDASGNVMATYEDKNSNVLLQEHHLFGAKRLGVETASVEDLNSDVNITESRAGQKMFELANHLGNVLAVVSDRRTGIDGEYT